MIWTQGKVALEKEISEKKTEKRKEKKKKGIFFFPPHLVKSLGKTVYFGMMEKKACWCVSLDPVIS